MTSTSHTHTDNSWRFHAGPRSGDKSIFSWSALVKSSSNKRRPLWTGTGGSSPVTFDPRCAGGSSAVLKELGFIVFWSRRMSLVTMNSSTSSESGRGTLTGSWGRPVHHFIYLNCDSVSSEIFYFRFAALLYHTFNTCISILSSFSIKITVPVLIFISVMSIHHQRTKSLRAMIRNKLRPIFAT